MSSVASYTERQDTHPQRFQSLCKLWEGFLVIQEEFDAVQAHLDSLTNLVTAIISLEEKKRTADPCRSSPDSSV